MLVVVFGLLVNFVCVWLLCDGYVYYGYGYLYYYYYYYYDYYVYWYDLNLCVVYLYVLVDVVILLLVIVVLVGGLLWNVVWLDLLMGIVGVVLVSVWVCGLIWQSSWVLLDVQMDVLVVVEICVVIVSSLLLVELFDLYLWQVGQGKYVCLLSLLIIEEGSVDYFKCCLVEYEELVYIIVEVNLLFLFVV